MIWVQGLQKYDMIDHWFYDNAHLLKTKSRL